MAWGDDAAPPVPEASWAPRHVDPGTVCAARVVIDGFHGLPAEMLLVAWDNDRATVRRADGTLQWYTDGRRQAYPRRGEIVVEDAADHAYPRDNRYMDALAVRSLQDLVETVNAEEVTSVDADGTIHIYGEHDRSRAEVVRAEETGIIVRASGVEGTRPWQLEAMTTLVVAGGAARLLLEPADIEIPPILW